MNNLYLNLRFTLERSTDSRLPFLDTEMKLISNNLHTSVHRKPTDTNLVIQYTSVCPKVCKFGLIDFYLNRALNVCTNYVDFKEELSKITTIFAKNQYPKSLIQKKTTLSKFIKLIILGSNKNK